MAGGSGTGEVVVEARPVAVEAQAAAELWR